MLLDVCSNVELAYFLSIAKNILKLIQIAGPIIAIIALAIHLIKLLSNPEEKKLLKNVKNSLLALVILFFIPLFVNVVVNTVDHNYSITDCLDTGGQNSKLLGNPNVYYKISKSEAKSIIGNPEDYDSGSGAKNETSSTSNQDFLQTAKSVWNKIVNGYYTYPPYGNGAKNYYDTIPIKGNWIDCSGYVSWVLYEYGYDYFKGKINKSYDFYKKNWHDIFGWEEIPIGVGEDVTSKVKPGDIIVKVQKLNNGNYTKGHVNIVISNKNGVIVAYDCGASDFFAHGQNPNGIRTSFPSGDDRVGKIIRVTKPQ